MTKSKLTDVVLPVYGKCNSPRSSSVKKITVHHMAGNLTVETCQGVFNVPGREASSNYGIGSDGRIALYVDEDDRAWTSNSYWNDSQAITIEVADYDTDAWSPSKEAYASTVALCADICNRYGITPTYTGDTDGSFTEHMMFASTSCPGPWWHSHMRQFVKDVKTAMEGVEVVADSDIKKIAQAVWEYIYKQGSPDEDRTLQKAYGSNQLSNGYNVVRCAFNESFEAHQDTKAILEKLEHLEVGDVTVDVDYSKMAQAVNDDAAKRLAE